MRCQFADTRAPEGAVEALANVSVFVEVAPGAIEGRPSIEAMIRVQNNGSAAVRLRNPFDLLRFLLIDPTGRPLRLPQKAPNLMVHRPRGPWKLDRSLPIRAATRDGAPLETTELDFECLSLAGGAALEVVFGIEQVVGAEGLVGIPAGSYHLQCFTSLLEWEADGSRVLQSPELPVEVA
jgi:hypothetical protein